MADTSYSFPNISGSRRFQTYMNQYGATSGRVPSASMLDDIIQAELDASSRRMEESRRLTESQRQFDIGQQNMAETAAANRRAGLIGTGMNVAGTAGVLRALTMKPGDPYFGETLSSLAGKGVEKVGEGYNYAKNLISPSVTPGAGVTGPTIGSLGAGATLTGADLGIPPVISGATSLSSVGGAGGETLTMAPSTLYPGATGAAAAGTEAGIGSTIGGYAAAAAPYVLGYGIARAALPEVLGSDLKYMAQYPLTGGLRDIGEMTGIKPIREIGRVGTQLEEELIQKPLDWIGGGISWVGEKLFGW